MIQRLPLRELGGLLALAIGVPIVLALGVLRTDGGAALWFSLFCVSLLLMVPIYRACIQRRFDPLEPIFLVLTAYFLYFIYSPARDFLDGQEYFFGVHVPGLVPRGSLYLCVGLIALYVGYYAKLGERLARVSPTPTSASRGALAYAVILAGTAILLFGSWVQVSGTSWMRLLTLGQFGPTPDPESGANAFSGTLDHYLFGSLDWFTGAFMIAFAFTKKSRWRLLPFFLLIFALYSTIGLRFRILILVLAPIVYYYLGTGRRPRLSQLVLAAAVAVLLIGGIGSVRNKLRTAAVVTVDELSVSQAQQSFVRDLSIYQPYLALLNAMPAQHDFVYGASFAYLVVHPIPRRLWSGKPEAPVLGIIRNAFGGNAAVQAGVAYPNIGEYYANFGLIGIIGGMMLFGLVMRWLWEFALLHRANPWIRCVYGIALPLLVVAVSRGYFVQIFQSAVFFIGPVLGGMWVARRRAARRHVRLRRLAAAG